MASFQGKALGTFGAFGCFSFHETKNYSMGEGGALVTDDDKAFEAAEIIREKGTDRSRFFRGQVDKYTWVEAGSSYLPSELNAAYLFAQLEVAQQVNADRLASWGLYHESFADLAAAGLVQRPVIPAQCLHNGHMYYLKVADVEERTALIEFLKGRGVMAVFHYVPLHSASAGRRFGRFHGEDRYTTAESERLVRLPMYYGLTQGQVAQVVDGVQGFFAQGAR
jgi:dTDP-4-amino-4,6-dideoxygalactose transaminase